MPVNATKTQGERIDRRQSRTPLTAHLHALDATRTLLVDIVCTLDRDDSVTLTPHLPNARLPAAERVAWLVGVGA